MIKIGVVGVGHMGRYHVNTLAHVKNCNLTAICDVNETGLTELAKTYSIEYFTDYEKFLTKVDAVIVAVPTHLHFEFASKAIQMGKHVLVEKPITHSIPEAEKLFELADKHNIILQVGHVERFNAAVQELQHIIKNPYLIQAQRLGPRSRILDVGAVLDLMIHDIDIILAIAQSDWVDIQAYGRKVYTEFEDVANASILFKNGVIANITASRVTDNKIRTLGISQEGSYVFLDYATQDLTIYRQPQTKYIVMKEEITYKQESFVERVFVHKENALTLEQEHFIECITENCEPLRHPQADLNALKIAVEIMEKIRKHW